MAVGSESPRAHIVHRDQVRAATSPPEPDVVIYRFGDYLAGYLAAQRDLRGDS